MKHLKKVKGLRDCTITEVMMHIADLNFQYQSDREIFEDQKQTFEARQSAYVRMCRARDLLESWKGVEIDIRKKSRAREVI